MKWAIHSGRDLLLLLGGFSMILRGVQTLVFLVRTI